MDQLFLTSIIMSVIIIVFLLHRKFEGKKFSSKVYYILWLLIAIRLILPFDISINNMGYKFNSSLENSSYKQNYIASNSLGLNADNNSIADKTIESADDKIKDDKPRDSNSGNMIKAMWLKDTTTDLLNILKNNIFNIWLLGAVLYLSYNLLVYYIFKEKIKKSVSAADTLLEEKFFTLKRDMNIRSSIDIKESTLVDSPMIVGLINPALLIPRDMDLRNIDYIFRHELVHLKRRDILYKALIFLAVAINWFNPIVHLMLKVSGEDLELSCDEEVVKGMSRDQRIIYSKTLIEAISRGRSPVYTTNFSGGGKMIKKRIDGIFLSAKKKSSRPLILMLVLAMLTSSFLIGCDIKEEDLTDKLYKNKTEFIGDNSKVSAIASALEYPKGYEYESIKISADEENDEEDRNNQLQILFKEDNSRGGKYEDQNEFIAQSAILFSLIDNLDVVFYVTQESDRETAFASIDRVKADNFTTSVLGSTTKNLGESKSKFKELVDYYQEYTKELEDDKIDPEEDINDIGNITNFIDGLTLSIKPTSVTPKSLILNIENNSEKDYTTGGSFVLYKKLRDDEWEEIKDPLSPEDEDDSDIKKDNISELESLKINSKGKLEQYIQWDSFGDLDKGEYLVVKTILNKEGENNYSSYSIGEKFEIKSNGSKPLEPEKPSGELELDEIINSLSGVKMTADGGSISPKGMDIKFINNSNIEYIFSEDFFIQRKQSKGWEDVKPILEEGEYAFHDIALVLPAGEDADWKVDWAWLYGSLEKGDYRIVKTVIGEREPVDAELYYLGVEFKIK